MDTRSMYLVNLIIKSSDILFLPEAGRIAAWLKGRCAAWSLFPLPRSRTDDARLASCPGCAD